MGMARGQAGAGGAITAADVEYPAYGGELTGLHERIDALERERAHGPVEDSFQLGVARKPLIERRLVSGVGGQGCVRPRPQRLCHVREGGIVDFPPSDQDVPPTVRGVGREQVLGHSRVDVTPVAPL